MENPEAEEVPTAPPAEPGERPRKRRFSLIREFSLADMITLTNGASGTGAIFLCLMYVEARDATAMWAALALFPVALVADVLDGSVARWRHKSSPFGADLDSLADVVSFGVGPAALAFALGCRGGWDALVLIYFVCCGISRLARFNVTANALMTDKGKVSHFEGTPIPTSLVLVAVLAVAYGLGAVHDALWLGEITLGPWRLHPIVLMYALSGTAMISQNLRIPKP